MKVDQFLLKEGKHDWLINDIETKSDAGFVLVFTSREKLEHPSWMHTIRATYPNSEIISCSTAGEIYNESVLDDSISVVAVTFDNTPTVVKSINNINADKSYESGEALAQQFNTNGLSHVMVFSDGQSVNGTDLIDGMKEAFGNKITITGGLAGDGTNFTKTLVGHNDNITGGNIVALGFYGDKVHIGHGSQGGWDTFGPVRQITKSAKNVLFELDGKNALALYKDYLGDKAEGLPGTALLFPLAVEIDGKEGHLVRTILNINEEDGSMIFAGDIPLAARARFMKANFDNLVEGAATAATKAFQNQNTKPGLAIMISCVGRKLVLGQRIEEEVEEAKNKLGDNTAVIGFYSYGEICPINNKMAELHNQTMTITTFSED